jgi:hypothetical protein
MKDGTIVTAKNIGVEKENGAENIRAVLVSTRRTGN